MPYQHCPSCRLTVHLDDEVVRDGPCPRCGERLADEPRRLFAPTLDPEAVRLVLQTRGGRFARVTDVATRSRGQRPEPR
jgi:hypothetical protein